MQVKNCKKCGRLYNYVLGESICPECLKEIEDKFQEVKKYIRDNGNASMEQICEACDVETGQVQQWIRQERLQFSAGSPVAVNCEKCGTRIMGGRFCARCRDEMARSLNQAMGLGGVMTEAPKSQRDNSNRMRFLDNK
ncbi:MAG: flagellar protein [Lachnospiraceae bacterium]|nr:flagellar protein [Lachnospiraceae bacterium]